MNNVSNTMTILDCPYCESRSFKFMEREEWMFLCHSCQRYMPWFKVKVKETVTKNVSINFNNILNHCVPVTSLNPEHECRQYAESRCIPLDRVMFAEDFSIFGKYVDIKLTQEPRMVIPFFDGNNNLFGLQGRSLGTDGLRYITLMFDKTQEKIFGQEHLDKNKKVVAVEGPIDSLFVDNAIAIAGSDLAAAKKIVDDPVLCYDNEPRSPAIVDKMRKNLDSGFKVVIWPSDIKQKDINDMHMSGYNVNEIIQSNVYTGMMGILKLNQWKKCK